ncbi:MAG TPA: hypothetical protein VIV40_30825 [Kofleriaceae bacterium]
MTLQRVLGSRYEIRPGSSTPGQSRYATHSEVLLALKATAKDLGLIAKLPAGNRGSGWRASIEGLTIAGDTKRVDDHSLETFHVLGPCDQQKLLAFAEHIAAIAGKQAVIGETDDEFWFVEKPRRKSKKTKPKGKRS